MLLAAQHQEARLSLRLHGQGDVHGHLVAVEVGVVGGTGQRMQLHGPALYQHRLKGLNAQTVQRRRAVEQHRMILDDVLPGRPIPRGAPFPPCAWRRLMLWAMPCFDQALHDEGLEQLQRHFLGQAALMQLELRAYDDNGTAGIVHALAQQVLAEATLLTAQQIGQAS